MCIRDSRSAVTWASAGVPFNASARRPSIRRLYTPYSMHAPFQGEDVYKRQDTLLSRDEGEAFPEFEHQALQAADEQLLQIGFQKMLSLGAVSYTHLPN